MCGCNASGLIENPDCSASTTTRHVCMDVVILTIRQNSKSLNSALSFEPGIYYLISE